MRPVPPQLTQSAPFFCLPLPWHTGQISSPVPGVPGAASSPGFNCLVVPGADPENDEVFIRFLSSVAKTSRLADNAKIQVFHRSRRDSVGHIPTRTLLRWLRRPAKQVLKRLPISRFTDTHTVVVRTALHQQQALVLGCRIEQFLTEARRNITIVGAMHD